MREEEKIFAGVLFSPGDPELRKTKLRTHNLCTEYNRTFDIISCLFSVSSSKVRLLVQTLAESL